MAILLRDAGPQIPTDPAYYAWSIQVHLVATALAITLSALITVLGRVYIRAVTLRVFGADDYFIVAAMVDIPSALTGLALLSIDCSY